MVAVAAALGAVTRHTLDHVVSTRARSFPVGTFAVNVSGSLGLGVLVGIVTLHDLPVVWQIAIGTGFLGAYTTFSTWMVEAVRMMQSGERARAICYVVASWAAGTGAAWLGFAIVRAH
ncbi:MAG: fluoride efflux transporter CrcB [Trueperaceae bacterium]|nr:fluoride efflux transporter CrcB [Trueperaceae bacterium]